MRAASRVSRTSGVKGLGPQSGAQSAPLTPDVRATDFLISAAAPAAAAYQKSELALPVAPPSLDGASPSLSFKENPPLSSSFPLPSSYTEKAKGAAYRMKATPDLQPLHARRKPGGALAVPLAETARSYRLTFEKLGDARYLSHRNTMDVFERALRASGAPVRYTEGYNPHLRMSMGPALPLGHESRHELFDVDVLDALTGAHVSAVNARLPDGIRITSCVELPKGAKSLGRAATGAVYSFTLPNGETRTERLALSGTEATTPKKFLEKEYGVPPEGQHGIRVRREETVLAS
jgi:hypothetical protein